MDASKAGEATDNETLCAAATVVGQLLATGLKIGTITMPSVERALSQIRNYVILEGLPITETKQ
jgi:hypothetical protein